VGIELECFDVFAFLTAVANADVDVYVEPDGVGTPIGVLREGNTVTVVERRQDKWCHVKGEAVLPDGDGWVFGEFLTF
jgi:hypothetical protein